MTSEWPSSSLNHQKRHVYTEDLPQRPRFSSVLLYDQPFSGCKAVKKLEVHFMTSNRPWTLNCQNYPVYAQNIFPQSPNFHPFCFVTSYFITSEWHWTLNCHSTMYTLNAWFRGPNFGLFWSTTRHFWIFEMQGCQQLEMHQMRSQWIWTLNQKYPAQVYQKCTKWPQTYCEHLLAKVPYIYPRFLNFTLFQSMVAPFPDNAVFFISLYVLQWWTWNLSEKNP